MMYIKLESSLFSFTTSLKQLKTMGPGCSKGKECCLMDKCWCNALHYPLD